MISGLKGNWFGLLFITALISLTEKISAATDTSSWSLASSDGQCAITVSLNNEGDLNCGSCRAGKIVIQRSPLGLRRDDQDFEHSLTFDRAGKSEKRREKYELFAGTRAYSISRHRTDKLVVYSQQWLFLQRFAFLHRIGRRKILNFTRRTGSKDVPINSKTSSHPF